MQNQLNAISLRTALPEPWLATNHPALVKFPDYIPNFVVAPEHGPQPAVSSDARLAGQWVISPQGGELIMRWQLG